MYRNTVLDASQPEKSQKAGVGIVPKTGFESFESIVFAFSGERLEIMQEGQQAPA
jgi:hypothetical protein